MEDKKLNEQESLELISNMIKQTNHHMALGAGNTFIAWGVILLVVSIAANVSVAVTESAMCMWLYFLIPVLGFPIEWFLKRKAKLQKEGHIKSYIEDSIEKVWKCVGGVLIAYPMVVLLLHATTSPRVWIAMFFLGMLMPTVGSYITGVLLKIKKIELSAAVACAMSLIFLKEIVQPDYVMTLNTTYIFPVCAVFALIIPGVIINREAKENNK